MMGREELKERVMAGDMDLLDLWREYERMEVEHAAMAEGAREAHDKLIAAEKRARTGLADDRKRAAEYLRHEFATTWARGGMVTSAELEAMARGIELGNHTKEKSPRSPRD